MTPLPRKIKKNGLWLAFSLLGVMFVAIGGWPTLNDRSILLLIFRVAHPSDFASGKGGALDCLRLSSFASSEYLPG